MMKNILLLGAGKSATALIKYLLGHAETADWQLTLVDQHPAIAAQKAANHPRAVLLSFDIQDGSTRRQQIQQANLVISLLPPSLHLLVAQDCIALRRNLLTASYLSEALQALAPEIARAGILMMGEMGLDPGIDHMSAMRAINRIRAEGGAITAFESFCGALVAPESDDTPWHYKISWSPQALLTAGAAGATFRKNGKLQRRTYAELFTDCPEIAIPAAGTFAFYPNRDSERYARLYQLNEVPTILRATLRHPAFCRGWGMVVRLGLTDQKKEWETNHLTYKNWLLNQLRQAGAMAEKSRLMEGDDPLHRQFAFLGLTDDALIGKDRQTSGAILMSQLHRKLALQPDDRDMVVMLHRITHQESGRTKILQSVLNVKGRNGTDTAIAETVGLPLGIMARLLLSGKISLTGLHIPVLPEVYEPVLAQLEKEGIRFQEYVH